MTEARPADRPEPGREVSVGQAAGQIVTQLGALVGCEVALAKAELAAQARQFSVGGLALLTAAVLGVAGGALFVATVVLAIALALPGWAATLIVGGAFVLLAAAAAGFGAKRLRGAGKPLPMTAESVRADLIVLKDLHLSRNNGHRPAAARPQAAAARPGEPE